MTAIPKQIAFGGHNFASRAELLALSFADQNSFFLDLSNDRESYDYFKCSKIIRCLPGRRLACIGQWRGQTVFAKLFFDSKRGKTHWRREENGVRALRGKGILTPDLIYSHIHSQEKIYLSMFEYIHPSANVAQAWEASNDDRRQNLLDKLIRVLSEHHRVGIRQSDLHLENFLLAGESVYTLDGAGIVSADKPLGKKASLLNLANLFAQLDAEYDQWADSGYDNYVSGRSWLSAEAEKEQFAKLIKQRRITRKKIILKKTTRECSAYICHHSWRRFTIYDRRYDSANLRAFLAMPDRYIADAELIKDGNTNTVAKASIDNRGILVKRYNIKNWRHALSRACRRSRAGHSWRNSQRLLFYGIETPQPVALVENRWGPFRRSTYFLTEYVDGVEALSYFQDPQTTDTGKQFIAGRVANLFKKLHAARISHGDFKATNFLVSGDRVYLVDLDSMKEHWSELAFRKAWTRDARRFVKNWSNNPKVSDLFEKYLGAFTPPD